MDEELLFDRYYNLALRFLSYRPRSEKETYNYLVKKIKSQKSNLKSTSQNEKLIAKITQRLAEHKFVDDLAFAKFWISQRTKYKPKPLWIIKSELVQKGINRQLIDDALLGFDESKSLDLESARKLAAKKLDFYRSLSPQKRREKVMSFLLRKGFNYDIVKKVLK